MAIAVGDKIPDINVMTFGPEGPIHVQTADVLGSGKVVLFAVPGAFTPTCSDYHLPSYVIRQDELRAKGVHLGQRRVRDGRLGQGSECG
jgi:peroxiredoxin